MFVIVAGGGTVGYHLTKELLAEGHEVVLIEKDRNVAGRIAEELGPIVLARDACEGRWLAEAGVVRADAVIAVTGDDEDNLIICQMARFTSSTPVRTIARVKNPKNEAVLQQLGVDATVSSTTIIKQLVEQEMPQYAVAHLATLREAGLEFVEFHLVAGSPAAGRRVAELRLPAGSNIILILRQMTSIYPEPATILQPGDRVIACIRTEAEPDMRRLLVGGAHFHEVIRTT